jgi:hypothetical protein
MIRALEILTWSGSLGIVAAMTACLWLGLDGAFLHATIERCPVCRRLGWGHDGPPHPDGCPTGSAHLHGLVSWVPHRREH